MADRSFAGKVALVTGAGSGIGRATAVTFAAAGARVIIADVNVAGGEETLGTIRASGGDAMFVPTDVSEANAVVALIERTVGTYGRLDCAFNNAGINLELVPTEEWDEAVFERTWSVNTKGMMLCMKYEIRQMLKQGGGAIVNTASVEGLKSIPGDPGYGSSKHAVIGLTRVAALQYAKRGIRINAVCPGAVRTALTKPAIAIMGEEGLAGFHPIGRIAEPEEIAAAVLWLCSDGASFVVGHPLSVDGGLAAQ
ncbi:MAG: family oxidoreductase [Deltaproteobacteria bacterium]|nr:family oxidoreductase [Deltaproteobacteria bacterium]